jgi:hypothetical protein
VWVGQVVSPRKGQAVGSEALDLGEWEASDGNNGGRVMGLVGPPLLDVSRTQVSLVLVCAAHVVVVVIFSHKGVLRISA